MKVFLYRLGRFFTIVNFLLNKYLYKNIKIGLNVEIGKFKNSSFVYGNGCKLGMGSRIDIKNDSVLKLGDNVNISRNVYLYSDNEITIGNNTRIQDNVRISGNVCIGENCIMAPNVFISSGTHPHKYIPELSINEQQKIAIQNGDMNVKNVIIEDDVWLGINVVVLQGIKLAKGTVVGSNAVVTKNTSAYDVIAGVPAKKIDNRLNKKD